MAKKHHVAAQHTPRPVTKRRFRPKGLRHSRKRGPKAQAV